MPEDPAQPKTDIPSGVPITGTPTDAPPAPPPQAEPPAVPPPPVGGPTSEETPAPPPVPSSVEPPPPTGEPITPGPETSTIPPVISPPTPKRSRAKVVGTILALLILVISLPAGIILVQRVQEIRERAREVECVDDSECGPGYLCKSNKCVPKPKPSECTSDADCAAGQVCETGVCKTPTKESPPPEKPKPSPSPPSASPAPPGGGTWFQCSVTVGPEPNLPCGSCSITAVGAGTMSFSCELDCSGLASKCPGGSAGSYSIAHRWERCQSKGSQPCTPASADYIESADLGGPGPWTIKGQSTVNGSGTFSNPGCGRVQVDVQMSAQGTNVAGRVFDTGTNCGGTPPPQIASCRNIKIYDTSWNQLSENQLQPGMTIRIATSGGAGTYDRGRFRVNAGNWLPNDNGTNVKNPFGEFYVEYTIPTTATSLTFETMVHHVETNAWY